MPPVDKCKRKWLNNSDTLSSNGLLQVRATCCVYSHVTNWSFSHPPRFTYSHKNTNWDVHVLKAAASLTPQTLDLCFMGESSVWLLVLIVMSFPLHSSQTSCPKMLKVKNITTEESLMETEHLQQLERLVRLHTVTTRGCCCTTRGQHI